MSLELIKPVMENEQRNEALVEQSPRQPLEEDRTPDQQSRLFNALTEMLRRRQQ
jgi:hypothetical protein